MHKYTCNHPRHRVHNYTHITLAFTFLLLYLPASYSTPTITKSADNGHDSTTITLSNAATIDHNEVYVVARLGPTTQQTNLFWQAEDVFYISEMYVMEKQTTTEYTRVIPALDVSEDGDSSAIIFKMHKSFQLVGTCPVGEEVAGPLITSSGVPTYASSIAVAQYSHFDGSYNGGRYFIIHKGISIQEVTAAAEARCHLQLEFGGIIHIYVGSEYAGVVSSLFVEGSLGYAKRRRYITPQKFKFYRDRLQYIHIYGTWAQVDNLQYKLVDCRAMNDDTSLGDIPSLIYGITEVIGTTTFTTDTATTVCTQFDNCLSCDSNTCLKCDPDYCIDPATGNCKNYINELVSHDDGPFQSPVCTPYNLPTRLMFMNRGWPTGMLSYDIHPLPPASHYYGILSSKTKTMTVKGGKMLLLEDNTDLMDSYYITDPTATFQTARTSQSTDIIATMIFQIDPASFDDQDEVMFFYQEFNAEPNFLQQTKTPVLSSPSPLTLKADHYYIICSYYVTDTAETDVSIQISGIVTGTLQVRDNGVEVSIPDTGGTITLDDTQKFRNLNIRLLVGGSDGSIQRQNVANGANAITDLEDITFMHYYYYCGSGSYNFLDHTCSTSCPTGTTHLNSFCWITDGDILIDSGLTDGDLVVYTELTFLEPEVTDLCLQTHLHLEVVHPDYTGLYSWEQSSNSSNPLAEGFLDAFLALQVGSSIDIPRGLLEPWAVYTFTAYVNKGQAGEESVEHIFAEPLDVVYDYKEKTCECTDWSRITDNNICGVDPDELEVELQISTSNGCDTATLISGVDEDELAVIDGGVVPVYWSIESSNFTTAWTYNLLVTTLQSYTSKQINLPASYLEPYTSYTIVTYYTTIFGQNYSETTSVITGEGTIDLDFSGSTTRTETNDQDILIQLTLTSCYGDLTILWNMENEDTGDEFDIPASWLIQSNRQMLIPACSLPSGVTYELSANAYYTSLGESSEVETDSELTLQVSGTSVLTADILGGNIDSHPQETQIELTGTYSLSPCPNNGSEVLFSWSCQKSGSNCNDPDSVFGQQSSQATLAVPPTYFSDGDVLEITLTCTYEGSSSQKSVTVTVTGVVALFLEIFCYDCPAKYSQNQVLMLEYRLPPVQTIDKSKSPVVWAVEPELPFTSSGNQIRIDINDEDISETVLYVTVKAENSTHIGEDQFTLPINRKPKAGTLSVVPAAGFSLDTKFEMVADGFSDLDNDQLQYLFESSFTENEDDFKPISNLQLEKTFMSIVAGKGDQSSPLYIRVSVVDEHCLASDFAYTNIVITSDSENLVELVNLISILTANLDPGGSETLPIVSATSTELNVFENLIKDNSANYCPDCSGNGDCPQQECVCDPGFTLSDCSLTDDEYQSMIDEKLKLLNALKEAYENDPTTEKATMVLEAMALLTQNHDFNTEETMVLVDDIMENTLKVGDPDTVLEEEQIETAATIVDNMLDFYAENCDGSSDLLDKIKQNTPEYLESISRSSLYSSLASDDSTVITKDTFDIYTKKVEECKLQELDISTSASAPSISFESKGDSIGDCDKIIDVRYYSFRDGLLECTGNSTGLKTDIAVKLTDETGTNVGDDYSMNVQMPEGADCPDGCDDEGGGKCFCEDLNLFDPGAQFGKLFEEAQFDDLGNVSALANWRFWEAFAFWAVLVLTILFGVALAVVTCWIPKYCALRKNIKDKKDPNLGNCTKFWLMIAICHPFFNLFFIYQPELSKAKRASIYYLRLMLMFAFSSLFGTSDSIENVEDFINDVINPYLILLPYVTVIPINRLFECLVAEHPKYAQMKKLPTCVKVRRVITWIVGIIATLGSIFIIYVLAANKTLEQNDSWKYDFLFVVGQDFIITPLLIMGAQYLLFKYAFPKKSKKPSKVQSFTQKKFVDRDIAKILGRGNSSPGLPSMLKYQTRIDKKEQKQQDEAINNLLKLDRQYNEGNSNIGGDSQYDEGQDITNIDNVTQSGVIDFSRPSITSASPFSLQRPPQSKKLGDSQSRGFGRSQVSEKKEGGFDMDTLKEKLKSKMNLMNSIRSINNYKGSKIGGSGGSSWYIKK